MSRRPGSGTVSAAAFTTEELLAEACAQGGVCFHRIAPDRGERRFYRLLIQPSLFCDEVDLVREWGRLGAHRPRQLVSHHADLVELLNHLRQAIARRLTRGYRPGAPTGRAGSP